MATKTLYLTSTATSSPWPTTSKLLSESAPGSEVTLGPGEFDAGMPGASDAGQWNPSSALGDTTLAAEIDNTGSSPGTTREGWLLDSDLTGYEVAAGAWTIRLKLRANQGSGSAGRMCMRVSIVTSNSGQWTTVATIFATRITNAASTSSGQNGWRDQDDARITVTSTSTAFQSTVGASGAAASHTFTSGQRILIEFGFCDGDSNTDRTWRLDYNQGTSYVVTPNFAAAAQSTAAGVATATAAGVAATAQGGAASTSAGVATATAAGVAATGSPGAVSVAAGVATSTASGVAANAETTTPPVVTDAVVAMCSVAGVAAGAETTIPPVETDAGVATSTVAGVGATAQGGAASASAVVATCSVVGVGATGAAGSVEVAAGVATLSVVGVAAEASTLAEGETIATPATMAVVGVGAAAASSVAVAHFTSTPRGDVERATTNRVGSNVLAATARADVEQSTTNRVASNVLASTPRGDVLLGTEVEE